MSYASESGDIRIVAVGDTMLTRRLTPFAEPDYLRLVALMRGADVTLANLETTVRDVHEGYPVAGVTGTMMSTPPELLEDLKWMGVDIVATANNHSGDYGVGGVVATIEHLRRANIPHAGSGTTLGNARSAGYAICKNGSVGVVAATTATSSRDFAGVMPESESFATLGRAADPRPDAPGRAGTNPLRFSKSFTVDEEAAAALDRIRGELGFTKKQERDKVHFYSASEAQADRTETISFLGGHFRTGTTFSIETSVNARDAEANLRAIRDARRRADWVVFSFHNHELSNAGSKTARNKAELEEPADFAAKFARAAIDAGADVVAGHGPHVALGVEIYKGKPILHSLGNFIFQSDLVAAYPAEVYERFDLSAGATPADFIDARSGNDTRGFGPVPGFWRGLLGEIEFKNHRLSGLRLHPLDLGFGRRRSERGRPMLATGDVAEQTLSRVRDLSRRYGTEMSLDQDVAVVAIP